MIISIRNKLFFMDKISLIKGNVLVTNMKGYKSKHSTQKDNYYCILFYNYINLEEGVEKLVFIFNKLGFFIKIPSETIIFLFLLLQLIYNLA